MFGASICMGYVYLYSVMCRATLMLWGHLMDNSLSNQVQTKMTPYSAYLDCIVIRPDRARPFNQADAQVDAAAPFEPLQRLTRATQRHR